MDVFSSECNPDDRERKTSLMSWWIMAGLAADLVWDVGDGEEEDGPNVKKLSDGWLTVASSLLKLQRCHHVFQMQDFMTSSFSPFSTDQN